MPEYAEIRWYGGTDEGFVDVRPEIELWGTETEIARWEGLGNLFANKDLSSRYISELVPQEDWPTKLRK